MDYLLLAFVIVLALSFGALCFFGALFSLSLPLISGDIERPNDEGWRPDFKNRRWKRYVNGEWKYRDMTDRECLDFTIW
jgi:hypothetical protein